MNRQRLSLVALQQRRFAAVCENPLGQPRATFETRPMHRCATVCVTQIHAQSWSDGGLFVALVGVRR